MKHGMEFPVILELDPETGTWVAEAVGIPGAYSQGRTRDEALKNVREAIVLVRATDGLPRLAHVELTTVEA
jgi:predicted RNase H-like HicB family nuclease